MRKPAVFLALLLLAGCHGARVSTAGPVAMAPLPRPDVIAVHDFAIDTNNVRLDSSPGARALRAADGTPLPQEQAQAVLAARDALMDTLVQKLVADGLPARRVADGAAPPGALLVAGNVTSVNEGNRLRRVVVGFGAGKSSVAAQAQVFAIGADGSQRFIQAMTATADSGHMPGMGMGAAAGSARTVAASGALHAGGETRQGTAAEAASIGTALAKQIANFAVKEGWIPANAVR